MKQPKYCVECNDRPANHWANLLCYECLSKLLTEKLENED